MKNKGTILIIIVGAGFAFATFFRVVGFIWHVI